MAMHMAEPWLIIGGGRLATHLRHYCELLGIPTQQWRRSEHSHSQLLDWAARSDRILLAVADGALAALAGELALASRARILHFSGATHIDNTACAHPLMTFGATPYTLEQYQALHFCVTGAASLTELLPGFPNSFSVIAPEQKARYHAACVLGGNFTTLLTAKMLALFDELGVPVTAAAPYMQQILANVLAAPESALTGPIARRDTQTVARNLAALAGDDYQAIYRAFLTAHWPDYIDPIAT